MKDIQHKHVLFVVEGRKLLQEIMYVSVVTKSIETYMEVKIYYLSINIMI